MKLVTPRLFHSASLSLSLPLVMLLQPLLLSLFLSLCPKIANVNQIYNQITYIYLIYKMARRQTQREWGERVNERSEFISDICFTCDRQDNPR